MVVQLTEWVPVKLCAVEINATRRPNGFCYRRQNKTLYRKKVHALLPFNNPAIEDSYFLSAGEEGKMICWKVHKLTDSSQAA